jgi:hypothetical protein
MKQTKIWSVAEDMGPEGSLFYLRDPIASL